MSRRDAKDLDRALSSSATPATDELAAMAAVGEQIRNAYANFTPPHSSERAMFVRAISEGRSPGFMRFIAPATMTAVLLIGLLFLGRTALPGGAFYPVREVLRDVGLAPASVDEVQSLISWADRLLDRAEGSAARDPEAAQRLAFEAARVIGMAEGAFADLEVDERAQVSDELADVLSRAKSLLTEEPGEDRDRDADGKAVLRDDDDEDGQGENEDEKDGDGNDGSDGDDGDRLDDGANRGDDQTGPNQGTAGDNQDDGDVQGQNADGNATDNDDGGDAGEDGGGDDGEDDDDPDTNKGDDAKDEDGEVEETPDGDDLDEPEPELEDGPDRPKG